MTKPANGAKGCGVRLTEEPRALTSILSRSCCVAEETVDRDEGVMGVGVPGSGYAC